MALEAPIVRKFMPGLCPGIKFKAPHVRADVNLCTLPTLSNIRLKELLEKDRRLVVLADQPIRWGAVSLLGLIPKSGELTRDKTARLSDALRPKVPPYWRV